MEQLFLEVIQMSLMGSYVILLVLLLRVALRRCPKIFSYMLWAIVFLRLLVPFSVESSISLMPVPQEAVTQLAGYEGSGVASEETLLSQGNVSVDEVLHMTPEIGWRQMVQWLWLIGIVGMMGYSIYAAAKLKFHLKGARKIENNIYEMEGMTTPFVFGFLKPCIYLPTFLSEHEKAYIIKHEQTHINRLDHLIKPLAFVILTIHWFNPLVWLAFRLMSEDMELSCDERVIKMMGSEVKKDYSTSLLALSTGKTILSGCPLAFGENNVKGRIKNILNYKKPRFWVVGSLSIVVVIVSIGLLTNPKVEGDDVFVVGKDITDLIDTEVEEGEIVIECGEGVEKALITITYRPAKEGVLIIDVEGDFLTRTIGEEESYMTYMFEDATDQAVVSGVCVRLQAKRFGRPFIREYEVHLISQKGKVHSAFTETSPEPIVDEDTPPSTSQPEAEEEIEDKVLSYLREKLLPHFEAHYEVLGDGLSYYKETTLEDGMIEALIMYTVKYKNHDKDPDTVGYIKEAKEKNDPYYQTYYDEYLKPQEANYAEMKVVISPDGEMTLYQDMDPHSGEKWEVFE